MHKRSYSLRFFYLYTMYTIINEHTITVIVTTVVGLIIRAIEKRQMKKKDRAKYGA